MIGPFTAVLRIYLTDGETQAAAEYECPVGKTITREEAQAGIDKAVAAIQEQLGPKWRPMTREEFENAVINERTGGLLAGRGVRRFATKQAWDEE